MNPAAKAPSTTSSPSVPASTTSAPSSSSESRSASWPDACIVAATQPHDALRAHPHGQQPGDDRHQREGEQQRRPPQLAGRDREDHRECHDRPELARRARGQHAPAEAPVEQVGVLEDRHQRAERGRREGEPDQDRGADHAGGVEHRGRRQPERERKRPAACPEVQRRAAHAVEVDLHPGHEEQEREAELRERLEQVVGVREPEHLRADDDPQQDLGHDARHADATGQIGEHGRARRPPAGRSAGSRGRCPSAARAWRE